MLLSGIDGNWENSYWHQVTAVELDSPSETQTGSRISLNFGKTTDVQLQFFIQHSLPVFQFCKEICHEDEFACWTCKYEVLFHERCTVWEQSSTDIWLNSWFTGHRGSHLKQWFCDLSVVHLRQGGYCIWEQRATKTFLQSWEIWIIDEGPWSREKHDSYSSFWVTAASANKLLLGGFLIHVLNTAKGKNSWGN